MGAEWSGREPRLQDMAGDRPAETFPDPATLAVLEPVNHLMSDPEALKRDWDENGVQFFRGVIDPALATQVVTELVGVMRQLGALDSNEPPRLTGNIREAGFSDVPLYETDAFRTLLTGEARRAFLETMFGEPVNVTGQTQIRYSFPGDFIHDQPPHQDGPYMRVEGARTIWMPMIPMPVEVGGVAVFPGSHKFGMQPHVDSERLSVVVPGRKLQRVPHELMRGRWHSADYRPGDCLIFHANCIHASIPNRSDKVRFSVDARAQPARFPLTLKQRFSRVEMEKYVSVGWRPQIRRLRRSVADLAASSKA